MKYFGFIKQHGNDRAAKDIGDYLSTSNGSDNRAAVIAYLKKGHLCIPFMGGIEDINDPDDEEFIGYIAVYTDGTWFWPQYIIAYLEKYPNFYIDKNFELHALKNQMPELNDSNLKELEQSYFKNANFTTNNN